MYTVARDRCIDEMALNISAHSVSLIQISRLAGGPSSCANAKIGLIQFQLSLPKTDMDQQITIKDYTAMDRLLRQERIQIAKMVKHIAATGCNVLLIQKSILREALNDLALDFLAKAKILVVRDIERDDIDFIAKVTQMLHLHPLHHRRRSSANRWLRLTISLLIDWARPAWWQKRLSARLG